MAKFVIEIDKKENSYEINWYICDEDYQVKYGKEYRTCPFRWCVFNCDVHSKNHALAVAENHMIMIKSTGANVEIVKKY